MELVEISDPEEILSTDIDALNLIGKLRYKVWEEEGSINAEAFPNRSWVDELDKCGKHWVVKDSSGEFIAAARLTVHETLDDDYRDVQLWKRSGKILPLPTCDLGRLVVLNAFRGRGIAQNLNKIRIQYARDLGAKSIMVTASEGNARLLRKLGFIDIGETIYFDDRPNTLFHALQLNL